MSPWTTTYPGGAQGTLSPSNLTSLPSGSTSQTGSQAEASEDTLGARPHAAKTRERTVQSIQGLIAYLPHPATHGATPRWKLAVRLRLPRATVSSAGAEK